MSRLPESEKILKEDILAPLLRVGPEDLVLCITAFSRSHQLTVKLPKAYSRTLIKKLNERVVETLKVHAEQIHVTYTFKGELLFVYDDGDEYINFEE